MTDRKDPSVRFTWHTHWGCNYRCPYCFFSGRWEEYAPRNIYKDADTWERRWLAMAQKYGRCYIVVNGGEPFTYPAFGDIILRISRVHWPINITTNLSTDLEAFTAAADPRKISLSVSFHPDYHDAGKFIEALSRLRGRGFQGCNNIVAYPPLMPGLPGWLKQFEAAGHPLKINPFIGEYDGKRYPESFTPQERAAMGMGEDWAERKKRKSLDCAAGCCSALILPDGSVTRCGQAGDRAIFGNFFDEDFSLLRDPAPCEDEFCPCEEWRTIPEGSPETGESYIS
jgi:MoaA/NifB/PqqE/SkfB family radical SAM enzyme